VDCLLRLGVGVGKAVPREQLDLRGRGKVGEERTGLWFSVTQITDTLRARCLPLPRKPLKFPPCHLVSTQGAAYHGTQRVGREGGCTTRPCEEGRPVEAGPGHHGPATDLLCIAVQVFAPCLFWALAPPVLSWT
jgi:hypothetical protein